MAKKYTIREFFESDEKLAIHTPTEEEAVKLCNAFVDSGYKRDNGRSYDYNCDWYDYTYETTYSKFRTIVELDFCNTEGFTILTIDDIIFDDDKEPKEYNVKIEVKKVRDRYDLYINNAQFCYWNKTEMLDVITCTLICYIIGRPYTEHSELQDYLLENHFVDTSTKMTIKEIEQKLGIQNLEIIE